MRLRTVVPIALSLVLIGSSLPAQQTSTETGQKDKTKTETVKGQKSGAVTNSDLAKTKKKPAIAAAPAAPAAQGETASGETSPVTPAAPGTQVSIGTDQPPAGWKPSDPATNKKLEAGEIAALRAALLKAKERVDLLTLKMLSLRQQYDRTFQRAIKDQIQKALDEITPKLEEAKLQEQQAREALEKYAPASSEPKI